MMPGHYLATATAALWVSVTPQTMTQDVPAFRYEGVPGSVQPVEWRTSKPIDVCPIVRDGHVIGFSLSCRGSLK